MFLEPCASTVYDEYHQPLRRGLNIEWSIQSNETLTWVSWYHDVFCKSHATFCFVPRWSGALAMSIVDMA